MAGSNDAAAAGRGPYDAAVPAPRRVALNALFLDPAVSGGPETYIRGLVPALARAYPALELIVLTTRRGARALRADAWMDFARVLHLPADEGQRGRRLLAEQVLAAGAARRWGADLIHSLASTGPVRPLTRSVVTLHDVTFTRIRTFSPLTTLAMRTVVAGAARSADVLISGSMAARDEACAALGLDRARFAVIPHGAGRPPVTAPAPSGPLRERLRLDGRRVVLCVGAVRPHKNQRVLVEALPWLPGDVALVLAGVHERGADALPGLAARLGVGDRLHMPGYLPDAEVETLWGMAACLAFPTRGEGFGLPVLEAMGRGVPVACSDLPVLREVGAGVARYFPPHDPAAAAVAIRGAMADKSARDRGRARAAEFSWEAAARGTHAAYERALA
jgi:glycosyltransferase involved in cell wall biosynthesis